MTLTGAIVLPDGTWVRGRGLRRPVPSGEMPAYGLYLGSERLRRKHDASLTWPHAWVRWADFWVPADRDDAAARIRELHVRARSGEDVEVACFGGVGRTGTVVACLAVCAGLGPDDAVAWARAHYTEKAAETPWQRRWVTWFSAATSPPEG